MRTTIELLTWLFLCLFQWWWGLHFSLFGISPDFLLLSIMAYASFDKSKNRCAIWAFLLGLYADVFGNGPIGLNSLVYTLFAWAVQNMSQRIDMFDRLTQVLTGLFMSFIAYLVSFGLLYVFASCEFVSVRHILLTPIFNAIAAPIVFTLALKLKNLLNLEERLG